MGKTHQALKQAEKEYINRQQQNMLASRQKFSRKWNFYSILSVLLIEIGRISYYWGTRSRLSPDFKEAFKSAVSKTTKINTVLDPGALIEWVLQKRSQRDKKLSIIE